MNKRVIFFNGPPNCGKDTAVKAIMDDVKFQGSVLAAHNKLTEPLKKGVHALFNMIYSWDYYDDPKVASDKNVGLVSLLGMSPREAYIWMSEEVMKPKFGEDVFGQLALNTIRKDKRVELHLFSDSGFVYEACPIVDFIGPHNCMVVEIHATRNGVPLTFKGDSRSYIGEELTQMKPGVIVRKIYNDIAGPEERSMYREFVRALVYKWMGLERNT
jgi:hypothetical protein